MNAQDLKNSILQLAIQGKLVEQRAEEGSAKELLKKIEAEKKKLIEEMKGKKEKPLSQITEDEILFDIPESWEWARLGDCCLNSFSGRSPKYTKIPNDNIAIGQRNNQNSGLDFNHLKYCTDEFMKNYNEDMYLQEYDILLNTLGGGTVGRIGLYHNPHGFKCITDGHLFVFRTGIIAFQKYLYYVLKAFQRKIEKDAEGSTNQSFLKLGNVKSYIIPIPPLEEQKRIVAKIEELKPYIDKYDEVYSEVEKLNKKFPEDMQKSILQYAIQGKLVEQRKEDGMAEELYKQIQEEKNKLIKEGKIKKTKALPEITENEYPFDIPENWKWVRLGNIVSLLGDGIHGTPVYDNSGDYYFINGNNLNDGIIKIKDDTKRVKEDQFIKHKRDLNENTVLVSINGTIGNVAFYGREKVILGKSACYFNLIVEDFKYYLYWVIKTKYFLDYAINKATGTTIKNVSLATMREFAIPLPPLEEQKRIVEKIQEILPYTKQLVK